VDPSGVECSQNKQYIQDHQSVFGTIDWNTFVKSGAKTYQILYNTPGAPVNLNGNSALTQNVSGSVIVPDVPASQIKGVVLYYHGTVFSKRGVPSDYASANGLDLNLELGAIFASQGYIVIAPDYIGQGVNSEVVHPYVVYPQINAQSGLYMVKAARQFLTQHNIIAESQSLPLYISSYSEGGAYALWASQLAQNSAGDTPSDYGAMLQANNLKLMHTVAVSGAYDLTDSMLPFAFSNVKNSWDSTVNPYNVSPGGYDLPNSNPYYIFQRALANLNLAAGKIALSSYLIAALVNYHELPNDQTYSMLLNPNFLSMNSCLDFTNYLLKGITNTTTCAIDGNQYSFNQLFSLASPNLTSENIINQLFNSAVGGTGYLTGSVPPPSNTLFLQAALTGSDLINNSISKVVNPAILDNSTIMQFIKGQNIYDWQTNIPLSLIYLRFDSVVTNLNSLRACSKSQFASQPSVATNSAAGMVNCVEVDNTKLQTAETFTIPETLDSFVIPLFLDHLQAEAILQLVALHQITNN
ncbi:MAG: alpha/beta hydrolase family protein, partial [Burkholderiales bacterium]